VAHTIFVGRSEPSAINAIRAWYRLDRAFAGANRWLRSEHDITGEQVGIARIIGERESWPMAQLRERLSMHPATLGQVLARLGERGIVQTNPDGADGRRRVVALTAEGRDLLSVIPMVGPVRLRTAAVDPDYLDMLTTAFNRAVELFGLEEWADDSALIDTKEKRT
jgi:DNA-binding MarR family transcriptional regulator